MCTGGIEIHLRAQEFPLSFPSFFHLEKFLKYLLQGRNSKRLIQGLEREKTEPMLPSGRYGNTNQVFQSGALSPITGKTGGHRTRTGDILLNREMNKGAGSAKIIEEEMVELSFENKERRGVAFQTEGAQNNKPERAVLQPHATRPARLELSVQPGPHSKWIHGLDRASWIQRTMQRDWSFTWKALWSCVSPGPVGKTTDSH